jgi:DMSO reductase family type II enzyme chaperone
MSINESLQQNSNDDINAAYSRAALYSALALGFQEPDEQILSRLLADESRSALVSAAFTSYPEGAPDLVSVIESLPLAEQTSAPALAAKHRVLFGHTARGGVPPYETEYGNEALFQQPQSLGDLMGFYHAFGLKPKAELHERPDHVSCECEFLLFLALKEALALEQNHREMLDETRRAEKLFLRDHLGRFFSTFAARLGREDPTGFYGKLAELGRAFIAAECARFQVASGPANLGLRPADDSRVPMACGNGAECALMPGAGVPDDAAGV